MRLCFSVLYFYSVSSKVDSPAASVLLLMKDEITVRLQDIFHLGQEGL